MGLLSVKSKHVIGFWEHPLLWRHHSIVWTQWRQVRVAVFLHHPPTGRKRLSFSVTSGPNRLLPGIVLNQIDAPSSRILVDHLFRGSGRLVDQILSLFQLPLQAPQMDVQQLLFLLVQSVHLVTVFAPVTLHRRSIVFHLSPTMCSKLLTYICAVSISGDAQDTSSWFPRIPCNSILNMIEIRRCSDYGGFSMFRIVSISGKFLVTLDFRRFSGYAWFPAIQQVASMPTQGSCMSVTKFSTSQIFAVLPIIKKGSEIVQLLLNFRRDLSVFVFPAIFNSLTANQCSCKVNLISGRPINIRKCVHCRVVADF